MNEKSDILSEAVVKSFLSMEYLLLGLEGVYLTCFFVIDNL